MKYRVKTISSEKEIEECERFLVNQVQWDSRIAPETYGYMGYVRDKGLFVKMVCREPSPKRVWLNHKDPVWKDSAMEVFLAFPDGTLTNESLYLNLEVNANGAMYAQYGCGRKGRQFLSKRFYEDSNCRAEQKEGDWCVTLMTPEWLLKEICGLEWKKTKFYCNFYKISESQEIEHYLSFSRIESSRPNFHCPVCFAEAELV